MSDPVWNPDADPRRHKTEAEKFLEFCRKQDALERIAKELKNLEEAARAATIAASELSRTVVVREVSGGGSAGQTPIRRAASKDPLHKVQGDRGYKEMDV